MNLRKRAGWLAIHTAIIFNLLALTLTAHATQTGAFTKTNPIMQWALKKGILMVLALAAASYITIALLYRKRQKLALPLLALAIWGTDLAWDMTQIGMVGI